MSAAPTYQKGVSTGIAIAIAALVALAVFAPLDGEPGFGWPRLLGRLHVLALHIPISLVLLAPALDFFAKVWRKPALAESAPTIWGLAAVSAFGTACLGILLAANEGYVTEDVFVHKWGGVSVAVVAALGFLLRAGYLGSQSSRTGGAYTTLSIISIIVVSFAAHAGGSLVHGKSYLSAFAPAVIKDAFGITDSIALNEFAGTDPVFDQRVRPLMQRYCFDCHGPDKQNGSVRLDVLNPNMLTGPDASRWHEALDMINSGEMPPDKARRHPSADERREIVAWMTDNIEVAADAIRASNRTAIRRLTKQQYTNTLQELLGLPIDFGVDLPDDGKSASGFSNNGDVLQVSPLHLEYYLDIARDALDAAIVVGQKPESVHYRVSFGNGIGVGQPTNEIQAYQSKQLNSDDFRVDLIDAKGNAVVAKSPQEIDEQNTILGRFGIGQRGSDHSRFWMSDRGMVLSSALPHKEVAPKSWQGPSPNLKLQMQRIFPDRGEIVMRVKASRGFFPDVPPPVLVSAGEAPVMLNLGAAGSDDLIVLDDTVILSAADALELINLVHDDGDLIAEDLSQRSVAKFRVPISSSGVYQFDVVYRPPQELEQGINFRIENVGAASKSFAFDTEELADHRVASVGIAYLDEGVQELSVATAFFTGMRYLTITPVDADNEIAKLVLPPDAESQQEYESEHPSINAFAGTFLDDGMDYAGFGDEHIVDAPIGAAKTYEFRGRLENLPIPEPASGDAEILSGITLIGIWNNYLVKNPFAQGPPLLVESIEVEAPYYETWPPESHRQIFMKSDNSPGSVEYTREVLERFMGRAFRRSVTDDEVDRYLEFWRSTKDGFDTYEDSIKEVLVAVLTSPSLLYLNDSPQQLVDRDLADWALANRLAYFLWNSPPDAELMSLAGRGILSEQLDEQVERLLADEKAWRFVRAFGNEWLRVDRLETMDVNTERYPTFTRFVKADMSEETYQLLQHVLAADATIFNLIDSDFVMLNQNLAEFYGIDNVYGNQFRPVALDPSLGRGGLLSQGAFLTGHSDGNSAHTVKRAVWLKDKILGDPPPPPPPNVPELDPESPGFENLTLKQQLEKHREDEACNDCHANIDPYGIVFEEYDAVGLLITGEAAASIDNRSVLADGTTLDGVSAMKKYILAEEKDAFARSMVEHLFAYALGRDVSFADAKEIDEILNKVRNSDYRMGKLVKHIVTSDSFAGTQ